MRVMVEILDESGEKIVGSSILQAEVLPAGKSSIRLDDDKLYRVERVYYRQMGPDLLPALQVEEDEGDYPIIVI